MTTERNRSTSTSAEPITPSVQLNTILIISDPRKITHQLIGQQIQVMGRDITLGDHQAPPVPITGELDSFRMNRRRIVLVMLVKMPRYTMVQPRVVAVHI
jgi:hypothetical protein